MSNMWEPIDSDVLLFLRKFCSHIIMTDKNIQNVKNIIRLKENVLSFGWHLFVKQINVRKYDISFKDSFLETISWSDFFYLAIIYQNMIPRYYLTENL